MRPSGEYFPSRPTAYARNREAENASKNSAADGSTVETFLGAFFCFLLFVMIIFLVAYPLTMYRGNPHLAYSDRNWWCYHCVESRCASRCWYHGF